MLQPFLGVQSRFQSIGRRAKVWPILLICQKNDTIVWRNDGRQRRHRIWVQLSLLSIHPKVPSTMYVIYNYYALFVHEYLYMFGAHTHFSAYLTYEHIERNHIKWNMMAPCVFMDNFIYRNSRKSLLSHVCCMLSLTRAWPNVKLPAAAPSRPMRQTKASPLHANYTYNVQLCQLFSCTAHYFWHGQRAAI